MGKNRRPEQATPTIKCEAMFKRGLRGDGNRKTDERDLTFCDIMKMYVEIPHTGSSVVEYGQEGRIGRGRAAVDF